MNTCNDVAWKLDAGERILWEGRPVSAPKKAGPEVLKYGFILCAPMLFLIGVLEACRSFYDLGLLPPNEQIGRISPNEIGVEQVQLSVVYLIFLGILFLLFVWCRWKLRNTRYAVTDQRVMIRFKEKLRNIPFSDIRCVSKHTKGDNQFYIQIWRWTPVSLTEMDSENHNPTLGPFLFRDATAFEAALFEMLGYPQDTPDLDAVRIEHVFPDWMKDEERKMTSAELLAGERLLWCGRPVDRIPVFLFGISWGMALLALWYTLYQFSGEKLVTGLGIFVCQVGGVGGWLLAFVWMFPRLMFLFATVLCLCLPWMDRRNRRRIRYLVSDRRAWRTQVGKSFAGNWQWYYSASDIQNPVVRQLGTGRSDILFQPLAGRGSTRRILRALGFADLPDAEVPLALAALEKLRHSVPERRVTPPAGLAGGASEPKFLCWTIGTTEYTE